MHLAVAAALALSEMGQTSLCDGPGCPTLKLGVRTGGPVNQLIMAPRFYRAQPEILFGFRPTEHATLLVGGGAGPAFSVGHSAAAVNLTMSGALGVRLSIGDAQLIAIMRAESALRGATAVTFDVRVTFGRAR